MTRLSLIARALVNLDELPISEALSRTVLELYRLHVEQGLELLRTRERCDRATERADRNEAEARRLRGDLQEAGEEIAASVRACIDYDAETDRLVWQVRELENDVAARRRDADALRARVAELEALLEVARGQA